MRDLQMLSVNRRIKQFLQFPWGHCLKLIKTSAETVILPHDILGGPGTYVMPCLTCRVGDSLKPHSDYSDNHCTVLHNLCLEDSIPKVQTILKTSRLIGTEFGAKWGKLALNSVPNL